MYHVKICGVRELPSAILATTGGAHFLGFNFVPNSRREVNAKDVRIMIEQLRQKSEYATPQMVGVFANQPTLYVNAVAEFCNLDLIQLSGEEPMAVSASMIKPVIKAIKVNPDASDDEEFRRVEQLVTIAEKKGILPLLDRYDASAYGGTGKSINWHFAKKVGRNHRILLAGGLTPENVAEAIDIAKPWGVDVASGIETNGTPDPIKIAHFLEEAHRLSK